MGAASSVQTQIVQTQLVPFFAEEFERIGKLGLSGEELAQEFHNALSEKIPMIQKVMMESSESGKSVNVSRRQGSLPELCHATLHGLLERHTVSHLVCVDGSAESDLCMELALRIKRKRDKLIIFHSFNLAEQSTLHPHFQRDTIISRYQSLALTSGMSTDEAERSMMLRERADDEDAKDSIVQLIGEYDEELAGQSPSYYLPTKNIDFVIIGFSGRKGADKSATGPTVMGSSTSLSLRSIARPIIVVKSALPPSPAPLTFVCAVDLSDRAKKGLALIMTMIKSKDRLICLHVAQNTEGYQGDHGAEATRELEIYFKNEMEMFGPASTSVVVLPQNEGKTRAQIVCEFVNETCETRPNFLCLSPRARLTAAEELGSISAGIILDAKCNIIMTKTND